MVSAPEGAMIFRGARAGERTDDHDEEEDLGHQCRLLPVQATTKAKVHGDFQGVDQEEDRGDRDEDL